MEEKNYHPTVKPISLMSYLVTLGSREGDLVLDPFVGSGTTCIAAKLLSRKYIGMEMDDEYVVIAQERIKAHKPEKTQHEFF
jgi:site-specific DNA-methyltransferase (adenine-specific)